MFQVFTPYTVRNRRLISKQTASLRLLCLDPYSDDLEDKYRFESASSTSKSRVCGNLWLLNTDGSLACIGNPHLSSEVYQFIQIVSQLKLQEWQCQHEAITPHILIGCLGTIGRMIATMMVKQGARNIVYTSRSGASTLGIQNYIEDLRDQGGNVEAFACDAIIVSKFSELLQQIRVHFPPIRGAINYAMQPKIILLT